MQCSAASILISYRFYEGAHKLNTLDLFKRLGVMPEDLPAVIFAGIGRTVFRDIGLTSLGFRLGLKWLDYNFLSCIICFVAPFMPDFKQAKTQTSKRTPAPASNGSKQE